MLTRSEVVEGFQQELADFEGLIRDLDDAAWKSPTRCEGWVVNDIASHVIGTLGEVVAGRAGELGNAVVAERIVEERRGRSAVELADELATARSGAAGLLGLFDDDAWNGPLPGGATVAATIGDGVTTLWYDAYVHNQDIRDAIGEEPVRGPGLRASVIHLRDLLEGDGWGPATIAVDGVEELQVGSSPATLRVGGDPLTFVLVATGRVDPTTIGLDETVNIYRPR